MSVGGTAQQRSHSWSQACVGACSSFTHHLIHHLSTALALTWCRAWGQTSSMSACLWPPLLAPHPLSCTCLCLSLQVASRGCLVSVALNMHGTRAVQKLVETLSSREQRAELVGGLRVSALCKVCAGVGDECWGLSKAAPWSAGSSAQSWWIK